VLLDLASDGARPIAVPRAWLIAPDEENAGEEREGAVSSLAFDSLVSAFPIGAGELGLHVASYQMNDQGSIHAAAGRDAFLVYAPEERTLRPGLVGLGITRRRVKFMQCLEATFSHFLLADVNGDGLTDLGRIEEELRCDWKDNIPVSLPWYEQRPVSWYVMHQGRWEHDARYDGHLSERDTDLPLLGVSSTPVDFFGNIIWKTYDPARWDSHGKSPPSYLPRYRKHLIEEERWQGRQ